VPVGRTQSERRRRLPQANKFRLVNSFGIDASSLSCFLRNSFKGAFELWALQLGSTVVLHDKRARLRLAIEKILDSRTYQHSSFACSNSLSEDVGERLSGPSTRPQSSPAHFRQVSSSPALLRFKS